MSIEDSFTCGECETTFNIIADLKIHFSSHLAKKEIYDYVDMSAEGNLV